MKRIIFILIGVCLMLTSCATMFSEDTTNITIDSDPRGALIKVDGIPAGSTPASLALDSGSSHTIEISKEGYLSQYVKLQKSVKWGWQVFDFFLAPSIISNVIDLITPNGYVLKPNDINVRLKAVDYDNQWNFERELQKKPPIIKENFNKNKRNAPNIDDKPFIRH